MNVSSKEDDRLMQFLRRILDDPEIRQNRAAAKATYPLVGPIVVPVEPAPSALPLKCYFNVRDVIAKEGGEAYFGWSFYNSSDGIFMAQHHAVWKRPDGTFLDVTPNVIGSSNILFMSDPRVPFDYEGLRMPAALNWCAKTKGNFWSGPDGHVMPDFFLLRAEAQDALL